jgi:hypothetical protein
VPTVKKVEHEAPAESEGNIIVINTCGLSIMLKTESVNTFEYADKEEVLSIKFCGAGYAFLNVTDQFKRS